MAYSKLFSELLELFFQLSTSAARASTFCSKPVRFAMESPQRTLGFCKRFEIDLARKQMRKPAFFLSRLAWQARDQRLRSREMSPFSVSSTSSRLGKLVKT